MTLSSADSVGARKKEAMQLCKRVGALQCRQRVSLEQQVADLKSRLGSEVYARQAEKKKLLEVRYHSFCRLSSNTKTSLIYTICQKLIRLILAITECNGILLEISKV